MLNAEKKAEVLSRLKIIEEYQIDNQSIGAMCQTVASESQSLAESKDSLAPVLRTALVINWRECAMQSRYQRFRELFPHITNLTELNDILQNEEALEFCKTYLNINANPASPESNPKYRLLKTLTEAFLEYKDAYSLDSEIAALRHWSDQVNLHEIKSDFIGQRHGVGIGVVENLRLNLGFAVIKPDRHAIGVMKHFLDIHISPEEYTKFAEYLGFDARYFDCLIFEYGKARKIST